MAFAGRSNSGKSSAINAIIVRHGLARASRTPGRTKLLNFFEVEPGRRIIDLPGYGYADARAEERLQWTALIEELPGRESLTGLFVIVDIRRGIGEQDEQLMDLGRGRGLAGARVAHEVRQVEPAGPSRVAEGSPGPVRNTSHGPIVFGARPHRRAAGPEATHPDAGWYCFFLAIDCRRRFGGDFLRGRQP